MLTLHPVLYASWRFAGTLASQGREMSSNKDVEQVDYTILTILAICGIIQVGADGV